MLSVKWGFAVVVAVLIATGAAGPAHAITVNVFNSSGGQCGGTFTGTSSVPVSVTCDSVVVTGTVSAVTNGTTRQFSVTSFVADNNATVTKTIRVHATHNFSGSASTAGLGWNGTFKRGTLVTNIAKSSSTSFTGSVTCLPSNSVTALTTASYSVLSTATSYTANSFTKGTTKTPVPTNCSSQTLTGDINVTLQGAATFNDSLAAHSSAELLLGDNAPVVFALVSHFVNVQAKPNINVNPNVSGKVQIVVFCKKDFNDGDPSVLADQPKWSLPNPSALDLTKTTLGTAQVQNNKVGQADVDGNGCVDASIQFQVLDTGLQCGDTSLTFHTVVPMCVQETVVTGNKSHPTLTTQTTCSGDPDPTSPTGLVPDVEVQVEVPIDTSQWCG